MFSVLMRSNPVCSFLQAYFVDLAWHVFQAVCTEIGWFFFQEYIIICCFFLETITSIAQSSLEFQFFSIEIYERFASSDTHYKMLE